MKVQCNQCGKMFKVPDSQAQRSLKCVCKNIFLAVPMMEEIVDEKSEAAPVEIPPPALRPLSTYDPNADLPVEGGEENEEGLSEYVDFLRQSRAQSLPKEENIPKIETPQIQSYELAFTPEPRVETEEPPPIEVPDTAPEPVAVKSKPIASSVNGNVERPKVERPRSNERIERGSPANSKNKPQTIDTKMLILGGAGAISLLIVFIAIFLPQKQEEEKFDPYLTQLLTPQNIDTRHKIRPIAAPVEKNTPAVAKKPILKEVKNEVAAIAEVEAPTLLSKMRSAAFSGEFENIVRMGSTATELSDEEAAIFLDALFERAGETATRHRELLKKLEEHKKSHPGSSALLRTTAFAIIKNPAPEKNINKAIDLLKSLALTRADDPLVLAYLGKAYEELDRIDLAHRQWDHALNLEPHFVWLLQMRDQLYRSERKFGSALEMAEKLAKVPGHEAEGFRRMGEIHELQNDGNSAVHYFRKALKLEDSADLHLIIGDILVETNNQGAVKEYEAGLRAHPSRIEKRDLYLRVGRSQCDEQNYDAAFSAFRKAFAEDSHSVKIVIEKARCELSAKSYIAAAASLENALKLSPNNAQLWENYAFALLHQNKLRPALTAVKRSLELKSSDQAYFLMAQILVSLKKKPEAAVYLKKAIQMNPKNREAKALLKSLN